MLAAAIEKVWIIPKITMEYKPFPRKIDAIKSAVREIRYVMIVVIVLALMIVLFFIGRLLV